jgi:DNA primase
MPHIPPEIIEQIAAANDIVEVIGSYFPLKRMGPAYKALCPFHNERTPSFTVNPQRQIFKCFGCQMGGGVIRFVQEYEHIDFVSAVRKLAEKANIKIPEAEMTQEDYQRADLRRRLLALHAEAANFFHHQLMRGKGAEPAREYLKKRGLSAAVAKGWLLGYAPDSWDSLLEHARAQGFSGDELADSGLFSQGDDGRRIYDRFRGRVMFPICNDTGEVIAFSGRVLFAEQSPAKYVNSPETPLFTKGAVLFGLHKSKRALIEKKQAIVCEGQIDLITAFEHGVQNVIAPQGTAFTERQARILKRYAEEVVLCFDADAAGDKAAERSLPQLLAQGLGVRCAEMPPGEDPDSLIQRAGGEAFGAIIAQAKDFFDFQITRLSAKPDFATPRGKIAAARKLTEFISLIPEAVVREVVLNNAAVHLEIPADQLRAMLHQPRETVNLHAAEEEKNAPAPIEPIHFDQTREWLAVLALRDPASRAWLLAQGWDRVLDDGNPASALLTKILGAEFRPDDPASLNGWLATLPVHEESSLFSALTRPLPKEGKVMAEDCWYSLERATLLQQRQVLETRFRNPALTPEQQIALHEKIHSLHRQLAALPPPRPPKMGD